MLVFGGALRDGEVGAKGIQKDPQWVNPLGADRDLVEGQERKREGGEVTGNGGRCRHAAWGAYMSDGGWLVAGAGNFQVGGSSRQERRWGAVATYREGYDYEQLLMEGR